jgi:hypothetical protein
MTKAEKAYCARVVALGCAVCRREGLGDTPALIHHQRAGIGRMRAPHSEIIPLCEYHHTHPDAGIHGLGTKRFPEVYGYSEADLVAETKELARWSGV